MNVQFERQLNQINKAVNRNSTNENKRHIFFKTQNRYKKLFKLKRRKYEEGVINKLENLYQDNKDETAKIIQCRITSNSKPGRSF